MEVILNIIAWFKANSLELASLITSIIGVASIIVKLTPTLKDDEFLKKVIKFIGKYIALDKYGPKGE
jgi:hypothetical protein